MFSHIMVGSDDIAASRIFYDAVLGTVGAEPGFEDPNGRIFWMTPTGLFAVSKPINGEPACHGNGSTVGFSMDSPETADAWHAAGVAAGGASCEDPPGWRESMMGPIYLAYLRDPAGNKLCGMYKPA